MLLRRAAKERGRARVGRDGWQRASAEEPARRPAARLTLGRATHECRFVARKVLASLATLVFVVVFNFFLFRVVAGDPVANLFRGRNLTRRAARGAAPPVRARRLAARPVLARTSSRRRTLNFGRSYTSNEPVMAEIASRAWPTIALVGIVDAALDGHRRR